MLALLLPICKEQGEQRVLLTRHKSNETSRRTIISNGGKLENEIMSGMGRNEDSIIQRFWIDLCTRVLIPKKVGNGCAAPEEWSPELKRSGTVIVQAL